MKTYKIGFQHLPWSGSVIVEATNLTMAKAEAIKKIHKLTGKKKSRIKLIEAEIITK